MHGEITHRPRRRHRRQSAPPRALPTRGGTTMTHDDDQLKAALDGLLDFPATPNGCIAALDDLMLAVKDAELAGTISVDEREQLVAEVRGWIPPAVLRCLALANAGDGDASLQALRADDFVEQEGRELMEGIIVLLAAFERYPDRLPALIAGMAAA
jgi:hypothetical protein